MKISAASDPADAFERFVFVMSTREVREIYESECKYLATPYEPTDGDRPYIKPSYDARTPDGGSMHGFLERRYLPPRTKVTPRPDPDRFTRPRPFARARAIWAEKVLPLLVGAMIGYVAILAGAFLGLRFMQPDLHGLRTGVFLLAGFLGAMFYFVYCVVFVVVSTASAEWRLLRLVAATAGYLGFFCGAAWVIWLHGDPARIILVR
jgi:hypothetical protein